MRLAAKYSHMNGEEFLLVRRKKQWQEVKNVIASIDAEACRTKVSQEKTKKGQLLFSPKDLNKAFKDGFEEYGWRQERRGFWVTQDESLLRDTMHMSSGDQKKAIEGAGYKPIQSYNQTDFVKAGIAVEVQFGKYAFVAHDLFVKHLSFFVSGVIDVGIEILPMKEMEVHMSSGVPYFERDLLNVIRQGRGVPAVPLMLIGVAP